MAILTPWDCGGLRRGGHIRVESRECHGLADPLGDIVPAFSTRHDARPVAAPTDAPSLADLIAALREPSAYPHPVPDPVEVRQTHISTVFLAGDRAYKCKKPVDLEWVDYTTLARRLRFCEEEVRLNRRLAPDVYLGVVPVVRRNGALRLGGEGALVEWAVAMRRLPYTATLASAVERDALRLEWLDALATRLAAFHAAADGPPAGSRFGFADHFATVLEQNLAGVAAAAADGVIATVDADRLGAGSRAALDDARPLIDARARAGCVRECHGDLRLDHVYLFPEAEPPADLLVIDGIEFNDAFRFIDPVADIAFLVMDLGVHSCVEAARRFADGWFAASGDVEGRALLPLYEIYRAAVRTKVEAIRARATEVPADARERSRERARRHCAYGLELLERSP